MRLYLASSFFLAAILVAAAYVDRVEYRAAAVRLLAPVGALFGAGLAIGGGSVAWRTLGAERDLLVLTGVAIAAGWVLVFVLDRVEGHAAAAGCFGIAACALPLVTAGEWLAPVLMFLGVVAVAVAIAAHLGRSGALLLQIGAGLGLAAAGVILARADGWARPASLDGVEGGLLMAGAALLVWPLDRSGGWRAGGHPAAAALPLLHGLAFSLLAAADLAPQPWAASGVLGATLASALWHGIKAPGSFVPGPLATGAVFAAALLSPGLAVPAGIAAVLSSSIGALGAPYGISAGLIGGVVPLSAGWLVLLTAISRAFEPAGGSADLTVRLPWLTFVSLAPLVMTAGIVGSVRWVREAAPAGRLRAFAADGALLFSVLAVLAARPLLRLDASPLGVRTNVVWLIVLALLGGAAAAAVLQARRPETDEVLQPLTSMEIPEQGRLDRIAAWIGWTGVAALAGIATFLTFEGLKVGFL